MFLDAVVDVFLVYGLPDHIEQPDYSCCSNIKFEGAGPTRTAFRLARENIFDRLPQNTVHGGL